MPPKMDECTTRFAYTSFPYTNTITLSSPEFSVQTSISKEDLTKALLSPKSICCASSEDCANYKKPDPPKVYTDEFIRKANKSKYTPKQIIYNPPATVVFWEDGTKTVVKCAEGETYSEYYGFLAALGKKIFTTNSEINRIVKKHIPKDKEEPEMKPTDKSGKKSETFREAAEKTKRRLKEVAEECQKKQNKKKEQKKK